MKQHPPLNFSSPAGCLKKLEWEEIGIKICGQHLNNLKCVDDIALITDKKEYQDTTVANIDLNMNYTKLKIRINTYEDITKEMDWKK